MKRKKFSCFALSIAIIIAWNNLKRISCYVNTTLVFKNGINRCYLFIYFQIIFVPLKLIYGLQQHSK